MNCFAHAFPFLDDPYFAVGSCIPDWLSGVDRKVRAREKLAVNFVDDQDPIVSAVARGVVQHHQDDHWFHQSLAFNELSMKFAVELRELFDERGMRPGLIGHVVVEMFLDAHLHHQNPGKLDFFYTQVSRVDTDKVQAAVNKFSTRRTDKLSPSIKRFVSERYLYDYSTDQGAVYRLNRVLSRIGLDTVDSAIFDWLPLARCRVYKNSGRLFCVSSELSEL